MAQDWRPKNGVLMAWEYSENEATSHGRGPREAGHAPGRNRRPGRVRRAGSIACGDAIRFTFRVERHPKDPTQDVITAARYLTFGCTSAIAASEALCTLIEQGGFTPIEALKITNKEIVDFLDGPPQQKIHCSVMGAEALEAAVFNGPKNAAWTCQVGIDIHADEQQEGRIVCKCFSLSEPYIRRKIQELNLRTIPEITNAVKAGGACMACHHVPGGLQDLLNETWGNGQANPRSSRRSRSPLGTPAQAGRGQAGPFPYQFSKKVEKAIAEYVRPMLQQDGGDVEIVDIKDTLVYCRLRGPARLRQLRPDLADAGRANPEGHGRRTHPRDRRVRGVGGT